MNDKEIVLFKHEPLRPARTIDATAIENAYLDGNTYEQRRIEIYEREL